MLRQVYAFFIYIVYNLYQHRNKATNKVFYIGIGKDKRRAYQKSGRNKIWKGIVKKDGYLPEILVFGLTQKDACELEVRLIKKYGKIIKKNGGLCNLSDGGDGTGGVGCIRNNIIGQTFGKLTVISLAPTTNKNSMWLCKCECSKEIKVSLPNLKSGNTRSCGCLEYTTTFADLTGKKIGKLTVLSLHSKAKTWKIGKQTRTLWNCVCSCTNQTKCIVDAQNLKSGHTNSCGCYGREQTTIHGCCTENSRLYRIWQRIMDKCYNINHDEYKRNGAKGVISSPDWRDVRVFFDWAFNNGYADDLILIRINRNGNFTSENTSWVEAGLHNQYTTKSVGIAKATEIKNEVRDGAKPKDVAKKYGISYQTVISIKNGENYKNIA